MSQQEIVSILHRITTLEETFQFHANEPHVQLDYSITSIEHRLDNLERKTVELKKQNTKFEEQQQALKHMIDMLKSDLDSIDLQLAEIKHYAGQLPEIT